VSREFEDDDIEIQIADDEHHEKVFAEILYRGKLVAILSQENGPNDLLIEFPGRAAFEDMVARSISPDLFQSAIDTAKRSLLG
jgi:hypothetical protein